MKGFEFLSLPHTGQQNQNGWKFFLSNGPSEFEIKANVERFWHIMSCALQISYTCGSVLVCLDSQAWHIYYNNRMHHRKSCAVLFVQLCREFFVFCKSAEKHSSSTAHYITVLGNWMSFLSDMWPVVHWLKFDGQFSPPCSSFHLEAKQWIEHELTE